MSNKNDLRNASEEEEERLEGGEEVSVSDHEREADGEEDDEEEEDDDDSAQGIPMEGLHWQSNPVNKVHDERNSKESQSSSSKRKRSSTDTGTGTDTVNDSNSGNDQEPNAKHSRLSEYQRQLRNAREKKRSGKICDQFDHIRDTMVKAGVIVPKGTKGTILAAAQEYITMLQQKQKQMVLDNCLLIHQLTKMDNGTLDARSSNVVRQIAQRNGVAEILWPNQQQTVTTQNNATLTNNTTVSTSNPHTDEPDYAVAFRTAPLPMAIATLGGTFMDCNDLFCKVTNIQKEQLQAQTIFSLIDQEQLTHAFEEISHWIFSMQQQLQQQQQQNNNNNSNTDTAWNTIRLKSIVKDNNSNTNRNNNDPRLQVSLSPIREKNSSNLRLICVTLTSSTTPVSSNQNHNHDLTTQEPVYFGGPETNNTPVYIDNNGKKRETNTNTFFAVG